MIALTREDIATIKQSLPPHSRKQAGCDHLMAILTSKELEFERELCRMLEQNLAVDPEYQAMLGMVQ